MVRIGCEASIGAAYGLRHTVKCGSYDCQNRITIAEVRRQRGLCISCLSKLEEGNVMEELINYRG